MLQAYKPWFIKQDWKYFSVLTASMLQEQQQKIKKIIEMTNTRNRKKILETYLEMLEVI